jgi:hypothetical protein
VPVICLPSFSQPVDGEKKQRLFSSTDKALSMREKENRAQPGFLFLLDDRKEKQSVTSAFISSQKIERERKGAKELYL